MFLGEDLWRVESNDGQGLRAGVRGEVNRGNSSSGQGAGSEVGCYEKRGERADLGRWPLVRRGLQDYGSPHDIPQAR